MNTSYDRYHILVLYRRASYDFARLLLRHRHHYFKKTFLSKYGNNKIIFVVQVRQRTSEEATSTSSRRRLFMLFYLTTPKTVHYLIRILLMNRGVCLSAADCLTCHHHHLGISFNKHLK